MNSVQAAQTCTRCSQPFSYNIPEDLCLFDLFHENCWQAEVLDFGVVALGGERYIRPRFVTVIAEDLSPDSSDRSLAERVVAVVGLVGFTPCRIVGYL
jgi:hypothetical protein